MFERWFAECDKFDVFKTRSTDFVYAGNGVWGHARLYIASFGYV